MLLAKGEEHWGSGDGVSGYLPLPQAKVRKIRISLSSFQPTANSLQSMHSQMTGDRPVKSK